MLLLSRCLLLLLCAAAAGAQPAGMPEAAQGAAGMAGSGQTRRPSKKGARETIVPSHPPVLVDAVAYAANGEPVRDLTASDIVVTVQNAARKIVSVNYVNAALGTVAPASTTLTLKPDEIHRTLVFVADDLGLSVAGAQNVRQTLTAFLQEQMHEGDVVSIVRTASGSGAAQTLTSDRRELAEAIARIRYNPDTARKEAFASGARGALRQVLSGLTEVVGRKGVVLFTENALLFEAPSDATASDGAGRKTDSPAAPAGKPATSVLVDIAARASAAVSLIDVRGEEAPAGSPGGLAEVAEQTGGRFVTRTTNFSHALAQVLQDQLGYYLVSYETGEAPNDPLSGRPLAQYPVLTSTRAGVTLLARHGLLNGENFAPNAARTDVLRPSFTTPASDLLRGFTHPFASGAIPIQFAAVYSMGKTGPQLEGRLHIDAKDITFTRRLDGRTTGSLDVQMAALDENGRGAQNTSGFYELQLTPDQYRESLKSGFGGGPKLSIRTPGPYQVRVTVRDGTSGRIGSASQFVYVPDPSTGQFAITSIDLMNPSDANLGSLGLRILPPGAAFRYSYQVANLLAEAGKGSRMDEQTRIFHDGSPIFESKPTHWDFAPVDTSRLRTADGTITLGTGIQPGYYVLQITATDKLAKEPRTATEYLRFEVK